MEKRQWNEGKKVIKVRDYYGSNPARGSNRDLEHRSSYGVKENSKQRLHPASVIISALIVVLAASLPLMSLWFANQAEVSFKEALLPASVFILAGLLFFFVLLPITRRPFFSGVYSAFAIFLLADFQIVRGLVSLAIQGAAEKYLSAVLGIIILAGVFMLLYKLTKEAWLRYAVRIAAITLASVMALSFIMGNPAIASVPQGTEAVAQASATSAVPTPTDAPTPIPTVSSTPATAVTPSVVDGIVYANQELESEKLPNVYCFILDEYSSAEILEKYYGFDNSYFINYLKEHRFNISSTSLCNIPETTYAIGELHSLEPFPKNISVTKARSYRNKNAALYTSFRSLGYTTYSNCARLLFPTDEIKDHMDVLADLSTLDREPPLAAEPEPEGTDEPAVTPEPTAAPTPTERRNMYEGFEEIEVDTDWRDEFFTSHTEKDETMYDLAIGMSVLSLFMEKMTDRGMLDEEEDVTETDEEPQPTADQPSSSPVPDTSITPAATADIEDSVEDDEEDIDDEEEPGDVDQGEEAPLDSDAASDPVSYDELVPIPKRLSVHAKDMYGVLQRLDQLQTKGFAQPTVLFNYIRQPHVPFIFDKYGNALPTNVKYYWKNPNYYLGQLKFITTHMMHVIDVLLETDPDCVIIIQSDHGVRWRQMVFPTTATKDIKDQHYVLNYVYYRGQILDIEGLSPINTYRTVLTRLGLDMPLVEDPRALEFRGQKYGIPDDDPRLNNIDQ